jgi:uncharacterized phage protein (TIGR01671 family)
MISRRIKFRVWDQKDLKFRTFGERLELTRAWDTYCLGIQFKSKQDLGDGTSEWDLTVQQYTGLKDVNGVEIYEGDLVDFYIPSFTHGPEREDYQKAEVWFDEEWGGWAIGKFKGLDGHIYSFSVQDCKDFKVVGNIFENEI